MDEFRLGTPALVCRWRIANKRLPLENRHLRALAARTINGEAVSTGLVAWAKQHVEWTLEDGATEHPDGVLLIAVDEQGRAAMSLGPYRKLTRTTANDLLQRARNSWREAERTHVSPEDLWLVQGETLVWATAPEHAAAGTASLVDDLARTLGMPVRRDEELLEKMAHQGIQADEVFLVSDEHGVVPAANCAGQRARKFAASYRKLLDAKRARLGV
jgi:hypothetical protein